MPYLSEKKRLKWIVCFLTEFSNCSDSAYGIPSNWEINLIKLSVTRVSKVDPLYPPSIPSNLYRVPSMSKIMHFISSSEFSGVLSGDMLWIIQEGCRIT